MSALPAWQQPAWQALQRTLAEGRLGHALLLTGPPHIGKRALAEALAARLLCTADVAHRDACGQCRACSLRAAGTHPDRRDVALLEREDGRLKTEIGVEQIRELSAWFALTPQLGRAQVALIEPAELLNHAAANALLKTLEEPLPERFLVLITARPHRLPATVRSRCQRIASTIPDAAQARAAVLAGGATPGSADEALVAADGHPGLALRYLADGSLALRREVRDDLIAIADGRARAALVAPRWVQDRLELRLRLAAECVREFARKRAGSGGAAALGDFPPLAAWFDRANQLRDQLSAPLRHDLLLADLLVGWHAAFAAR